MRATQLALPIMRAARAGAIVNIASSAGQGRHAHPWPEYATAKAGPIRFTTSLRDFDAHVRVNCLVPDWIATERVTEAERTAPPPPIPLSQLTAQVERLVSDETLSGRAIVLARGQAPICSNDARSPTRRTSTNGHRQTQPRPKQRTEMPLGEQARRCEQTPLRA
jgi:NAD(P)-dependent dehydrogenase (short-subunit alcohol dehydrogenase family)